MADENESVIASGTKPTPAPTPKNTSTTSSTNGASTKTAKKPRKPKNPKTPVAAQPVNPANPTSGTAKNTNPYPGNDDEEIASQFTELEKKLREQQEDYEKGFIPKSEYEKTQQEYADLQKRYNKMSTDLEDARESSKRTSSQLSTAYTENARLNDKLFKLNKNYSKAQTQLNLKQDEVNELTDKINKFKESGKYSDEALEDMQQQLEDKQNELQLAQKDVNDLNDQITEFQKREGLSDEALEDMQQQLEDTQSELTQANQKVDDYTRQEDNNNFFSKNGEGTVDPNKAQQLKDFQLQNPGSEVAFTKMKELIQKDGGQITQDTVDAINDMLKSYPGVREYLHTFLEDKYDTKTSDGKSMYTKEETEKMLGDLLDYGKKISDQVTSVDTVGAVHTAPNIFAWYKDKLMGKNLTESQLQAVEKFEKSAENNPMLVKAMGDTCKSVSNIMDEKMKNVDTIRKAKLYQKQLAEDPGFQKEAGTPEFQDAVEIYFNLMTRGECIDSYGMTVRPKDAQKILSHYGKNPYFMDQIAVYQKAYGMSGGLDVQKMLRKNGGEGFNWGQYFQSLLGFGMNKFNKLGGYY